MKNMGCNHTEVNVINSVIDKSFTYKIYNLC